MDIVAVEFIATLNIVIISCLQNYKQNCKWHCHQMLCGDREGMRVSWGHLL